MPIKYEEKKDNEFDQILEENIVLPRDSYIHIYMKYIYIYISICSIQLPKCINIIFEVLYTLSWSMASTKGHAKLGQDPLRK